MAGAQLAVNVNDIFDTYYHVAGWCNATYCNLGAGRTVLTSLRYRW